MGEKGSREVAFGRPVNRWPKRKDISVFRNVRRRGRQKRSFSLWAILLWVLKR